MGGSRSLDDQRRSLRAVPPTDPTEWEWARHAFALGPASRDALVDLARRHDAMPAAIDTLRALPPRAFDDFDDLILVISSPGSDTANETPSMPGVRHAVPFDAALERVLIVRGPGRAARFAVGAATREFA